MSVRRAWAATYAPLYCATSSPSTKTLSFASISSAMASFSASRTVISLAPPSEAYLLATRDGVIAAGRNAGRKAGAAEREADSRREAGRRSLEAAIEWMEVEEKERGRWCEMRIWREGVVVDGLSKLLFALRSASRGGSVVRARASICTFKCWANSPPQHQIKMAKPSLFPIQLWSQTAVAYRRDCHSSWNVCSRYLALFGAHGISSI